MALFLEKKKLFAALKDTFGDAEVGARVVALANPNQFRIRLVKDDGFDVMTLQLHFWPSMPTNDPPLLEALSSAAVPKV